MRPFCGFFAPVCGIVFFRIISEQDISASNFTESDVGKPTWHCYGLACILLPQMHLQQLQSVNHMRISSCKCTNCLVFSYWTNYIGKKILKLAQHHQTYRPLAIMRRSLCQSFQVQHIFFSCTCQHMHVQQVTNMNAMHAKMNAMATCMSISKQSPQTLDWCDRAVFPNFHHPHSKLNRICPEAKKKRNWAAHKMRSQGLTV